MEVKFKGEWCKKNVFANANVTIQWHFITHLIFFDPAVT